MTRGPVGASDFRRAHNALKVNNAGVTRGPVIVIAVSFEPRLRPFHTTPQTDLGIQNKTANNWKSQQMNSCARPTRVPSLNVGKNWNETDYPPSAPKTSVGFRQAHAQNCEAKNWKPANTAETHMRIFSIS